MLPLGLTKPLVLPGVNKKALAKIKPLCYDDDGLATASQRGSKEVLGNEK